ncbi:hypothetical protein F4860DRAFT_283159 [Xylaria cubensis]|nr:hypothetical protein F4860DRAFT_283159 [Xylaria cubensis]
MIGWLELGFLFIPSIHAGFIIGSQSRPILHECTSWGNHWRAMFSLSVSSASDPRTRDRISSCSSEESRSTDKNSDKGNIRSADRHDKFI